jgi:hypothetical protein
MFEHRLGLALGKSIGEVRSLPYDEFVSWKLFYQLEPWGWHDREYRTAVMLTQGYNSKLSKKGTAKKISDFIRDMPDLIIQHYESIEKEQKMREKLTKASRGEKKLMIARALGVTVGKEVKIDHSSGDKQ